MAVAIARAKLAGVSIEEALGLARRILEAEVDVALPEGAFWRAAFHTDTLRDICRLREGLIHAAESDAAVVLRAAILGILHGPRTKVGSYLSNQMQRTFSPKPEYAVRFWKERDLEPCRVNVLGAVERETAAGCGGNVRHEQGRVERCPPWRRVQAGVLCGRAVGSRYRDHIAPLLWDADVRGGSMAEVLVHWRSGSRGVCEGGRSALVQRS